MKTVLMPATRFCEGRVLISESAQADDEDAHHAAVVLDEPIDQTLDDLAQPAQRCRRPLLGVLSHDQPQSLVDGRRALLEVAGRLGDNARKLGEACGIVLLCRLGRRAEPEILDGVDGEFL